MKFQFRRFSGTFPTISSNRFLLVEVLKIKRICELRAEHKGFDNEGYEKIRLELLSEPSLKPKLPLFIEICETLEDFWFHVRKPKFEHYIERRQFLNEQFEPVISFLEKQSKVPSDGVTSAEFVEIDWDYVTDTWQKMLDRRNTDPAGAITSAKTLLEDVCKHILDESGTSYFKNEDLPNLYYKASQMINLHPSQHTENVDKKILGVCNSSVLAVGEFRNKYADSHGKGKTGIYPDQDYVRFVVNISGIVATLMIEKWIEILTNNSKHPPDALDF